MSEKDLVRQEYNIAIEDIRRGGLIDEFEEEVVVVNNQVTQEATTDIVDHGPQGRACTRSTNRRDKGCKDDVNHHETTVRSIFQEGVWKIFQVVSYTVQKSIGEIRR